MDADAAGGGTGFGGDAVREIQRTLALELDLHGTGTGTGNAAERDLDPCMDADQGPEEFPGTFIDKDEMVETSDDQDILGSPHSSFSYEDTLSNQEIDGLTNNKIILEYPVLHFEETHLLPFDDELDDWFSHKDLLHLPAIMKISKGLTINDLDTLVNPLVNEKHVSNGKILESLIKLTYLILGEYGTIRSRAELKQRVFHNALEMVNRETLIVYLLRRMVSLSFELTDASNLSIKVNLKKMVILSHQFFYVLTIIQVILLSFNSKELNHYTGRLSLMKSIEDEDILVQMLKALDRWRWVSENSENNDPLIVLESITSKVTDNEKRHLLAVTNFKIRNVLSVFNNLLLFQFGDTDHMKSTEDFLKFKFETSTMTTETGKSTAIPSQQGTPKNDDFDIIPEDTKPPINEEDDVKYSISSIDYNYYVNELTKRYPTYVPPEYEVSELLKMTIENNDCVPISELINLDALPMTQKHHLKHNVSKPLNGGDEIPEIHIATPMPSPTLTPQHTGNTKNFSNISEYEHTSNEIKKKLYITQSNYPNIYPYEGEFAPQGIKDATRIFYEHIKDDYKTKQMISIFEEFIDNEGENKASDFFKYTGKDVRENPMFEEEIRSLQNVEKFYEGGFPYFKSLIIIINRVISTNIIPTQKSVENGKTRQRTAKKNNNVGEGKSKPYLSDQLTTFERQKLEVCKLKECMLKSCSSILSLVQNWLKLSHVLKYEYFTMILFDENYLVYLFRYLDSNKIQCESVNIGINMDIDTAMLNNRLVYCEYQALRYLTEYSFHLSVLEMSEFAVNDVSKGDEMRDFEMIFQTSGKHSNEGGGGEEELNPISFILPYVPHQEQRTIFKPNERCCIIISKLLESMYSIVEGMKIQRIYKLIGIRPGEILRFYLTLHNENFYGSILKTIKMITPFIGKRWRSNNMDLVSFVYLFEKVEIRDNWLQNYFNVGVEESSKRGFENEMTLRSLIKYYNEKL